MYKTKCDCFDEVYGPDTLVNSKKVGEGAFGEVFLISSADSEERPVLKVVPIGGELKVIYSRIWFFCHFSSKRIDANPPNKAFHTETTNPLILRNLTGLLSMLRCIFYFCHGSNIAAVRTFFKVFQLNQFF